MRMPKTLLRALPASALAGLVLAGCVGVGSSQQPAGIVVGEASEIAYGKRMHEDVILGTMGESLYDDPELSAYVTAVGERLAKAGDRPDLPFHFYVLDMVQPNAFATMGGYVYISRGLLALLNSEAELAAVLGHEIGHINGRHALNQARSASTAQFGAIIASFLARSGALYNAAQQSTDVLLAAYGREDELEADSMGLRYSQATGYEAESLVSSLGALFDFQEVYVKYGQAARPYHSLGASHPKNDRRLYELLRQVDTAAPSTALPPVADDYLARIEGLPWQQTVEGGIVRDGSYYHGRRGLYVRFPDNWLIANERSRVVATRPANAATYIQFETYSADPDTPFEDFIETELKLKNLESGRTFNVDGYPGYMAIVGSSAENYVRRLVAVVYKDGKAYVFKGENKDENSDRQFIGLFSQTVGSFRRITEHERETVKGPRVVIREVPPDTTYEMLARSGPLGRMGPDLLRVLNGDYPNGQPRAGDRIKLIE